MKLPFGENFVITVHKEGERFIFLFGLVTFIMFFINPVLCTICVFATAFCVAFFRDPERIITKDKNLVISPADGRVTKIAVVEAPAELTTITGNEMIKISIFLSVFDVHVNRMPIGGKIIQSIYTAGKFLSATTEKSSLDNERNGIVIQTDNGHNIGCVQIAGLIARRIVSDAKEGESYEIGQRYGIIRFGSRMDIYLPTSYIASVSEGQTVVGGETIIAKVQ